MYYRQGPGFFSISVDLSVYNAPELREEAIKKWRENMEARFMKEDDDCFVDEKGFRYWITSHDNETNSSCYFETKIKI